MDNVMVWKMKEFSSTTIMSRKQEDSESRARSPSSDRVRPRVAAEKLASLGRSQQGRPELAQVLPTFWGCNREVNESRASLTRSPRARPSAAHTLSNNQEVSEPRASSPRSP
ncbi:hypothetical protein Q3G72_004208 [Acer saccharum]|nr:hypothetical protein Q3G72_004208 [Acer saccharum]